MTEILRKLLSNHFPYYFFLKVYSFLREKGRAHANKVGAERERKREGGRKSEVGSSLTTHSSMWGSNSRTLRSWPEPKSDTWLTEPPRHPHFTLFKFFIERDDASEWGWREGNRDRIPWGADREGEKEWEKRSSSEAGLVLTQSRARAHPKQGSNSWDHHLSRSQMLNQLCHPGTPTLPFNTCMLRSKRNQFWRVLLSWEKWPFYTLLVGTESNINFPENNLKIWIKDLL